MSDYDLILTGMHVVILSLFRRRNVSMTYQPRLCHPSALLSVLHSVGKQLYETVWSCLRNKPNEETVRDVWVSAFVQVIPYCLATCQSRWLQSHCNPVQLSSGCIAFCVADCGVVGTTVVYFVCHPIAGNRPESNEANSEGKMTMS